MSAARVAYRWTSTWHRTSPVGPICSHCQSIHGADATVAVDRFSAAGTSGYRSRLGGPARSSRRVAASDYCASLLSGPHSTLLDES